jgi:hypothetical protein
LGKSLRSFVGRGNRPGTAPNQKVGDRFRGATLIEMPALPDAFDTALGIWNCFAQWGHPTTSPAIVGSFEIRCPQCGHRKIPSASAAPAIGGGDATVVELLAGG